MKIHDALAFKSAHQAAIPKPVNDKPYPACRWVMRKLPALLAVMFINGFAFSQDLPAKTMWQGSMGGIRVLLTITIDEATRSTKAIFTSPDQGNDTLAVEKITVTKDSLVFFANSIRGSYRGKFNEDRSEVNGVWKQGAYTALRLKRVAGLVTVARPQSPKAPFPYLSEDVEYDDAPKSIHYGATLTLPAAAGKYPAVLLISGSGQEDRDEKIFDHKPFAVLADYLTRRGIAVLRVDDRGIGKSTGSVMTATSADFAGDVLNSIAYLKSRAEIDPKQIGLIGHSEGGMIAPMVALRSPDVAFIVSMAGVGVTGLELSIRQAADGFAGLHLPKAQVAALTELYLGFFRAAKAAPVTQPINGKAFLDQWRSMQTAEMLNTLQLGKGQPGEEGFKAFTERTNLAWMRYFINFDPQPILSVVKIPVLAINGAKDVQVAATDNLAGFEKYLKQAGNKDFKVVLIPGLNHLFQTADKGTIDEYEKIDETIAPVALSIIGDWIDLHVKK